MISNLSPRRFPGFIIAALLLLAFASFSSAIDLGRAFKRNNDPPAADAENAVMTTEDALAQAKKLVNDLNDAATGTVTSYQPGREKAPTTCNEIMARSVVTANEEKAAVMAEKDAVVKAATLLSEKNDDLSSQLKVARLEITALEKALAEATADCDAKLDAQKSEITVEMVELEQKMKDVTGELEQKLVEQKAYYEGEMNAIRDGAERLKKSVEEAMKKAKSEHEAKLKEVTEEAERVKQEAEQKVLAEEEKSKLNMDALRNATAATVAKIEKETAEKLAENEKEVAAKIEEAEQEVITIKANAQDQIMRSQQAADEKVASIIAKAERQHAAIMEDTQKKINDAKAEAEQKVNMKHMEMVDMEEQHQEEISKLKGAHAEKVKDIGSLMEKRVKEVHDMMDDAIAKASAKIDAEKKKYSDLERKLQEEESEAQNAQSSLRNDLELQRSESFKLEKELSFWKQAHDSQPYCNITLVKEDSQRFVRNALDGVSRGLDSQMELMQKTSSEAMLYIEKELVPTVERSYREVHDKAMELYKAHMATFVNMNIIPFYNENILPFYNENILPVYTQHMSPVVKMIETEAKVATQKVHEGVDVARSKAGELVNKAASDGLELLEEDGYDRKLPSWLYNFLDDAAAPGGGKEAVDRLSKGLLIITVILCRSLIYRIIGMMFSLVWFFCPLRLFVGGRRPKVAENGAKKVTNSSTKKVASAPQDAVKREKGNGKTIKPGSSKLHAD